MNANYLVVGDSSDEDDLLSTLSEAAVAAPVIKPEVTKLKIRKSKFFFKLSPTESQLEKRVKQFKPKELVHIDDSIVNRSAAYAKELPVSLATNIDLIREFFLQELSPLTLAVNPGANQAIEVVQRTVGIAVDDTVIHQFERMFAKGVNIKMANYVTNYLGLDPIEAQTLLQVTVPIKKEALIINPDILLGSHLKPEKPEGV